MCEPVHLAKRIQQPNFTATDQRIAVWGMLATCSRVQLVLLLSSAGGCCRDGRRWVRPAITLAAIDRRGSLGALQASLAT